MLTKLPTEGADVAPLAVRNTVVCGDALTELHKLPDECVQMVCCSPPYFGLRDYGVPGAIGLEPSLEAYLAALVAVFAEVRRVLRSDGTLWLNLGDLYNGSAQGGGQSKRSDGGQQRLQHLHETQDHVAARVSGLKPKDLVGLPWRVAFALQGHLLLPAAEFAALDDAIARRDWAWLDAWRAAKAFWRAMANQGWWLRSSIVWHKPNPMPESVTDRPTKSHELLFLLAKQASYYYDAEAIREDGPTYTRKAGGYEGRDGNNASRFAGKGGFGDSDVTTTGRNKRDVWTIATEPYAGSHFATFPTKLVEPCVLAGSPPRCCERCGAPWERVTSPAEGGAIGASWHPHDADGPMGNHKMKGAEWSKTYRQGQTTGWRPTCAHSEGAGSGRALVLDPFAGSGTTCAVAYQLGRDYLGMELSPKYVKLAEQRLARIPLPLWPAEEVTG